MHLLTRVLAQASRLGGGATDGAARGGATGGGATGGGATGGAAGCAGCTGAAGCAGCVGGGGASTTLAVCRALDVNELNMTSSNESRKHA